MKKDHLEILLEDISNKLDIVVEGHSVLDNKIDNLRDDVNQQISSLRQENDLAHKALHQMIKDTRQENKADHKKILSKTENLESRVTFLEKKTAHQ